MDVEYDLAKDAINQAVHGVSLEFGAIILANAIGDVADDRFAYGERRRTAFAVLGGVPWACAYTRRGAVFRPISVHRVREKEMRRWLRKAT